MQELRQVWQLLKKIKARNLECGEFKRPFGTRLTASYFFFSYSRNSHGVPEDRVRAMLSAMEDIPGEELVGD